MTAADRVLDGALALVLPLLAWRTLATRDLRKAIVLFIALGFLSALAWARLAAPDVALVEAAVGAGFTGALLMSALGWSRPAPPSPSSRVRRAVLAISFALLAATLVLAILQVRSRDPGLTDEVLAHLPESGVSHAVTAVLLNFRAYDTLLEVIVLLAAALGSIAFAHTPSPIATSGPEHPLLPVLARMLVPGIVLVAGHLLARGSHAPGGAFQAGALLGGAGILLILGGLLRPPDPSAAIVRGGLLLGPAAFLAMAGTPLFTGGRLLQYPSGEAGPLIVAIESALAVSIALVLTVFFSSVVRRRPARGSRSPEAAR